MLHLHIDRRQRTSQALMADLLQSERASTRIAVLCYNDATAIGADDAIVAARRQSQAMILSQGATEPVRKRIGQARSAIRVAVAHFPERFGSKLIPVVERVLSGESVAGPVYIEPALLTSANVRQYPKLAASV